MKVLVVEAAALGWNLFESHKDILRGLPFALSECVPPFPAVTCTSQAVFRTGRIPARTGVVCNGRYDPKTFKTEFWNQSARLVEGERIWKRARDSGKRVGMMFWQQSLGEDVDLLLSPAPIHKHHGGMIQDCYGKPDGIYPYLREQLGRPFDLRHYWGPMASRRSSRWITEAVCLVMSKPEYAPDVLFAYLPHLDYALQKVGPEASSAVRRNLRELVEMLTLLCDAASKNGYEVVVWGDYAITAATRAVFPNRHLAETGLFKVREVKGMTYPDLYQSRAFAMVDHQVAHVYMRNPVDLSAVRDCLEALDGVERLETAAFPEHPGGGPFTLTAEPGVWFAYPWWSDRRQAPDYATHVDIHSKIGFDPCELFWGVPLLSISLDTQRVRGTHGRNDTPVCIGATIDDLADAETLQQLALRLQDCLESG